MTTILSLQNIWFQKVTLTQPSFVMSTYYQKSSKKMLKYVRDFLLKISDKLLLKNYCQIIMIFLSVFQNKECFWLFIWEVYLLYFSGQFNPFSDVYGFVVNICVEKQSIAAAKLSVKFASLIQRRVPLSLSHSLSSSLLFMQMSRN